MTSLDVPPNWLDGAENRPDTTRASTTAVSANLGKPSQIPTEDRFVTINRYVLPKRQQRISLWQKRI